MCAIRVEYEVNVLMLVCIGMWYYSCGDMTRDSRLYNVPWLHLHEAMFGSCRARPSIWPPLDLRLIAALTSAPRTIGLCERQPPIFPAMPLSTLAEQAANAQTNFQSVPIMSVRSLRARDRRHGLNPLCSDLTDAASPDPELRWQVALNIRDACINVGFFYGQSHGSSCADIRETQIICCS